MHYNIHKYVFINIYMSRLRMSSLYRNRKQVIFYGACAATEDKPLESIFHVCFLTTQKEAPEGHGKKQEERNTKKKKVNYIIVY